MSVRRGGRDGMWRPRGLRGADHRDRPGPQTVEAQTTAGLVAFLCPIPGMPPGCGRTGLRCAKALASAHGPAPSRPPPPRLSAPFTPPLRALPSHPR